MIIINFPPTKKILLVDDEPDILLILEKRRKWEGGYEVDLYDDPNEALQDLTPPL